MAKRVPAAICPAHPPEWTLLTSREVAARLRVTDKALDNWRGGSPGARPSSDWATAACATGRWTSMAFLGRGLRQTVWENTAVKTKHLLSPSLSADTLLVDAAEAASEATRRGALYGVARDRLLVPLFAGLPELVGIGLGSVVELRLDRFGLSAGKSFRVIGRVDELARNLVILDLWG